MALMRQVWGKPYYAGRPLEFLGQPRYYAWHIRYRVYFFQSGQDIELDVFFIPGTSGEMGFKGQDGGNEGLVEKAMWK